MKRGAQTLYPKAEVDQIIAAVMERATAQTGISAAVLRGGERWTIACNTRTLVWIACMRLGIPAGLVGKYFDREKYTIERTSTKHDTPENAYLISAFTAGIGPIKEAQVTVR